MAFVVAQQKAKVSKQRAPPWLKNVGEILIPLAFQVCQMPLASLSDKQPRGGIPGNH